MTWTSVYNEALCAFFLLGAFRFLLRYLETGERRYWLLQWACFLLGFGALELNVVYPALAAAYTLLCARKYFLRTLPLFCRIHRVRGRPSDGGAHRERRLRRCISALAMLDTLTPTGRGHLGPPSWPP